MFVSKMALPRRTFLRGIQKTDASGLALFKTIYPGWYPGRAVHIHVRVYLGGNVVHTGQLFFPEKVTDAVHRRAPYRGHGRAALEPRCVAWRRWSPSRRCSSSSTAAS